MYRAKKITNDGLTRSGTGCFIAVPTWQRWLSAENNIKKEQSWRVLLPNNNNSQMPRQCLCSFWWPMSMYTWTNWYQPSFWSYQMRLGHQSSVQLWCIPVTKNMWGSLIHNGSLCCWIDTDAEGHSRPIYQETKNTWTMISVVHDRRQLSTWTEWPTWRQRSLPSIWHLLRPMPNVQRPDILTSKHNDCTGIDDAHSISRSRV